MKTFARTSLAVLFLTLAATSLSSAETNREGGPCGYGTGHACVHTPEINPSMATGAFAFLGGSVMLLRGRRKA